MRLSLLPLLALTSCSLFQADGPPVIPGPPPAISASSSTATSGAPSGSTSSSPSPPAASTQVAAPALTQQELTVAVHQSLDMTEDQIRAALAEASKALGMELRLKGSVMRIGQGYPAELNCAADYKKLTWLPAHVIVVARIGRCAESTAAIQGCAAGGGIRIHVVQQPDSQLDGQLWAHLLGHNAGLQDQPAAAGKVMNPVLQPGQARTLDTAEVQRVKQKNWNSAEISAPDSPKAAAAGAVSLPATADDLEWLKQQHVHGLPLAEVPQHLTPNAVPTLKTWLKDPGLSAWWGHAALALGALGSGGEEIRELLLSGDGQLSPEQYRVRADCFTALGLLAGDDTRGQPITDLLLGYLRGASPMPSWSAKHMASAGELTETFRVLAAHALLTSGKPQSLEALRATLETLPDDSTLRAVIRESVGEAAGE
jgi:hypothetical protein